MNVRGRGERTIRISPVVGVVLVGALIVYGSLYPWRFVIPWYHPNPLLVLLHSHMPPWNRWALRDAAINVAIYFPLGMAGFLALSRRLAARWAALAAAVLGGLALSAGMEMLQVYVPGRVTNISDVTYNFAGTAAGALAALVLQPSLERRARKYGVADLLLLAFWTSYQLYPFFPAFSLYLLRDALALLSNLHPVSAVEVWAGAAEWFALALVLESLFGRLRGAWLVAAMACLPLRIFVAERTLALNELLGAALALLLWSALPEKLRLRAGAAMLVSAIVLRELAPFHFSRHLAPFSWIPLSASLAAEPHDAAIVISRKLFDYGAAVWLLRGAGLSYRLAGVAMAAALAVLEYAQRALPGRWPEITDSLMALLMAFVLWLLSDSSSRRGLA